MCDQRKNFEQAAQIKAFSKGQNDQRVLELLARIATSIRVHAIDS